MVNSSRKFMADGPIAVASRPVSGHSKNLMVAGDSGANSPMTIYSNNLYDAGDILANEAEPVTLELGHVPSPPKIAAGNSQKFRQQRAMAAQKRLERLQLGGVAQNNESIAVVNISSKHAPASATEKTGISSAAVMSAPGLPSCTNAPQHDGCVLATSSPGAHLSGQQSIVGQRPSSAVEKKLISQGLAAVYDPSEDIEVQHLQEENFEQSSAATQGVPTRRLDLTDMSAFLVRPGPRAGTVQCYIERDKGGVGKSPCYRMHLDDGGIFLLAARKRKKSASSAYVISSSQDPEELTRSSSSYLGKLRSNFVGTEFTVSSNRSSSSLATIGVSSGNLVAAASSAPARTYRSTNSGRSTRDDEEANDGPNNAPMQEVAAVQFDFNVLGTRGPRKMTVAVPAVSPDGGARWRPAGPDDTLLERVRSGRTGDIITVMKNKTPKWNDAMNAYCLNFNGRVTEASVKNFQLVTDADTNNVLLQFGKISESCFTCDYKWPLSPLQAFCICLASFDNKLACE